MKLTKELAQKIVDNTMDVLGKNINIMDHNGIIIGSGNKNRIDNYHEVATRVIESGKTYIIRGDMEKEFQGVKRGINLPIKFQEKIMGVVGITGDADEVSGYGKIVKNMVELILEQEFLRREIELEKRSKEIFFQQLIGNTIEDKELLNYRLKLLNIERNAKRVVMVIKILPFDNKVVSSEIESLSNKAYIYIDDIFFIRGEYLVLVKNLKKEKHIRYNELIELGYKISTDLKNSINIIPLIGIGKIISDIEKLHESYKEARLSIEVGEKVKHSKKGNVYYINNLGYDYFLPFIDKQDIDFFLHNLFDQNVVHLFEGTELGELIEALVDNNINLSKTAEKLFIHRNTLIYRLNKINEISGLDPRNANSLFTLLFAYHIYLYNK